MSACFLGRSVSFAGSHGGLPGPAALCASSAESAQEIEYISMCYVRVLGRLLAAVYGLNCYLSVNLAAAGRATR
jgi:hypothetical protein